MYAIFTNNIIVYYCTVVFFPSQIVDLPIIEGNDKEIQITYVNLLKEFKKLKQKEMKRYEKLTDEVETKKVYFNSVSKECEKIAGEQYDLELKTAVGMINSKTRKVLTNNVNLIFII